jgi:predicted nucleotidyltransferase
MVTDFSRIIKLLANNDIKFILVGGVAANVHGSDRGTTDVDIVYARDSENLKRISEALSLYNPYLRDAPPDLPFELDETTLEMGLNFTLVTDIGNLDLFGEIAGGGNFNDLLLFSNEIEVFNVKCLCLNLKRLIEVKRAAGRPKDFESISELEAILEERQKDKI